MTIQKKHIKKLIITSIRENTKPFKEKKLRKRINKQLEESEIKLTKEEFTEIVDKLVAKGKLVKDGKALLIPLEQTEEIDKNHNETRCTNKDFKEDERTVINSANNLSNTLSTDESDINVSTSNIENSMTILLFYEYCKPIMTRSEQDAAIAHCYSVLNSHGVTGRLRVGREVNNDFYVITYRSIFLY